MADLYVEGTLPPSLRGQRCRVCNAVTFPPNPYGCEQCGATGADLAEHALAGRGRLRAFATTFLPPRKDVPAPFTVASITLDDGPVVRALLTCPTDESLRIGGAVQAVLVEQQSSENGMQTQLRFEPKETP
ncbi:MAG TPA: OB-fold domain-containing protein [Steroidobacter sp.]|uniref:Zn-ribbon domain-containing OB-fold protein n=1 Tax=Steroidobacter sp. TaxID=1978227 RepID=UPI002ED99984